MWIEIGKQLVMSCEQILVFTRYSVSLNADCPGSRLIESGECETESLQNRSKKHRPCFGLKTTGARSNDRAQFPLPSRLHCQLNAYP